jgi:hypothetical protein
MSDNTPLGGRRSGSAEPENQIGNILAGLASCIAVARWIVLSEPAAVVALITAARKAAGNDVENNTRGCLLELRAVALAQVKVADAALDIFETCSELANGVALAAPSAGAN